MGASGLVGGVVARVRGAALAPLMISLHGGGGIKDVLASDQAFHDKGMATLVFDAYEMQGFTGRTSGFWALQVSNEARQSMLLTTAWAAYQWAITRPDIDTRRIYFFGVSNGAAVVAKGWSSYLGTVFGFAGGVVHVGAIDFDWGALLIITLVATLLAVGTKVSSHFSAVITASQTAPVANAAAASSRRQGMAAGWQKRAQMVVSRLARPACRRNWSGVRMAILARTVAPSRTSSRYSTLGGRTRLAAAASPVCGQTARSSVRT